MNAAVLSSGTITMQCACSSISWGMPLSGAAMTSENTAAAASNRLRGFVVFRHERRERHGCD